MRSAEMLPDPGDAAAIVEPHDQLGAHRHPALVAPDQADEVDLFLPVSQRDEVDQRDAALGRFELRFENPGVAAVAA